MSTIIIEHRHEVATTYIAHTSFGTWQDQAMVAVVRPHRFGDRPTDTGVYRVEISDPQQERYYMTREQAEDYVRKALGLNYNEETRLWSK